MVEAKTAPKPKKVVSTAHLYNAELFETTKMEEGPSGNLVQKSVWKPEIRTHMMKCQAKACKELGVSSDHLNKCYEILNGRKVDGFFINDMIDRYGFSDGLQTNRAQFALKYGHSTQSANMAFKKLAKILQQADPLKAYIKYQKEYEDLLLKERRDNLVDGE